MSAMQELRDHLDELDGLLSDKNKEIGRLNDQCRSAETKWLNAMREATGVNLNNLGEVVRHIKTLREIATGCHSRPEESPVLGLGGRVVDHDNQSSSDQSDWVPKLGEPVRVKWGGGWKAGVVIKILPTQYIVKIFEDERSEGSDHSNAMLLIHLTPVNS